ncbi:homogentisate 1,2-dioxygenase, partial [Rhizobium leguminosarum]|uniref:homogentisate 1,2-dioxygenase n=1 Tax=Rhizobium leguminosarum TaxID=384 RepID=UPI003F9A2D77
FLEGVRTITTAGDAATQVGMSAHSYVFNEDMVDDYFFNADVELLIVRKRVFVQARSGFPERIGRVGEAAGVTHDRADAV